MPSGGDPKYDSIADILTAQGFKVISMQGEGPPSQMLFIKERTGPPILVTAPVDCSEIPDAAIRRIMETAQVSEPEYRHLLKHP